MDSNPHVVDVNITRFDLLMTSLWAPLHMAALYGVLWLALFATNVYQMMKLPRFHWATGEVVRMVVVAAIVATLFTIFAVLLAVICAQMVNLKNRGGLGAHRYALTPEGLVESTAVSSTAPAVSPGPYLSRRRTPR